MRTDSSSWLNRQGRSPALLLALCALMFLGGFWPAAAQAPFSSGGQPIVPGEFKPGEVLVKFQAGTAGAAEDALRSRFGATYAGDVYGLEVEIWQVPEGQERAIVEQLGSEPSVEYAQPNYVYRALGTPNDPSFFKQWAHTTMQSSEAWDISKGSSSVTIAVIDTGIDETHPDLASRIVAGYDFVSNDSNPHDLNGHGTHVAGIAAAVTNNGTGVAGMDWQARIMPVRVLDAQGGGYTSNVVAGINWAYANGADVLNLSLGQYASDWSLQNAVTNAHAAGSLVVAAMGNCRTGGPGCPGANPTMYPAACSDVMAVAATGPADTFAYYSQYGSHCDIAAPGGAMYNLHDSNGIYSTMPTYNVDLNQYGYYQNYDYLQGTSMATPYVAGLAALVWSLDPTLTPDEVQGAIETTAVDRGPNGWDDDYGHGRIDALAALRDGVPPGAPILSAIANPDGDGTYLVDWNDGLTATSYSLQEDNNSGFTSPTVVYTGAASQFNVSGHSGGAWYYRVRASNGAGDSAWSNVQSVAVKPTAPVLAPITNPDGGGAYRVSWSVPEGATGYTLEEDNNSGFTSATVIYSGANSQFDVSGQGGGTWFYRVRASNAAGDSPWSNPQAVVVKPAAPVLSPITNPGAGDAYPVSWTAPQGASAYTLQEDDNSAFTSPTVRYEGNALQYGVTGQPGGTWYYRVQASNMAGESGWSNTSSTTVSPPPWPAPSLNPIDNTDGDRDYWINWSQVAGADSYTLEESADPYFAEPVQVHTGPELQFNVTGQQSGTWYYRVRVVGPGGSGPWSAAQPVLVTSYLYMPVVLKAYENRVLIHEGFEGGSVPPAGWTLVATDPAYTWEIWPFTPPKPPPTYPGAYEGTFSAACDTAYVDQDEVLLSPSFQSATAQLQFYSFGDDSFWYDSSLHVWLVIGEWDGIDDVLVYTANGDWIVDPNHYYIWSPSSVDLTPYLPAGTPVRVGFQYKAGMDGDLIGLDAITITR